MATRGKHFSVAAASAIHLVNGGSQTGQAGQTVNVHLTAVRLSSHQIGPVTSRQNKNTLLSDLKLLKPQSSVLQDLLFEGSHLRHQPVELLHLMK